LRFDLDDAPDQLDAVADPLQRAEKSGASMTG
jgi:hypothetical protein